MRRVVNTGTLAEIIAIVKKKEGLLWVNMVEAAVRTVNYLNEHKHDNPIKVWNEVTIEIFGEGNASQKKG